MIENIRWLTLRMVLAFHQETLRRHGGGPGLRDEKLQESALARPLNKTAYDASATLFDRAAEYCAGVVGNHPFVDGNKRTGLLSAVAFLSLNGFQFSADEADIVAMIEALAAGNVEINRLSGWFSNNSVQEDNP